MLVTPSWGKDAQREKLEGLRGRIQSLSKEIGAARRRQDALQEALSQNEKGIARALEELASLDRRIYLIQQKLSQLKSDIRNGQTVLDQDRRWLKEQLRRAYALGHQGSLKVLLQAEDASSLGRYLTYYRYWIRQRSARIKGMREKIKALARLQKTLREQEAALLALRKSQKRALQSLEAQRKKRQKLLAGLSQEIRSQAQVLARLKADERRLATLLNRLQGTAKDVPAAAAPFQERLCWPVSGKLAARFGQVRRSGLPWQGVLILAPEGQPVRAVARGRIVFADWLRGYGFLVIIDHGGNYMSLYGHNQRLVKKVGDFVEAGEVIAYVGKSGGRIRPGLYFEIRRRGKPVDPTRACRIKVSSPSGP